MAQASPAHWQPLAPPVWVVTTCGSKRVRESCLAVGDEESRGARLRTRLDSDGAPPTPTGAWGFEAPTCATLALRSACVISCPCGWHGLGGTEAFAKHAAAVHGLPRYIALKLAPQAAAPASRCCLDCDARA